MQGDIPVIVRPEWPAPGSKAPDIETHLSGSTPSTTSPSTPDIQYSFAYDASYWGYRPSLPANAVFLTAALICLFITLFIALTRRRYTAVSVLLSLALVGEIVAYAARVAGHNDTFNGALYSAAFGASTVAPIFLSLATHLLVKAAILLKGVQVSPVGHPDRLYMPLFVSADLVAAVLTIYGLATSFPYVLRQDLDNPDKDDAALTASRARWVLFAGFWIQTATLVASGILLAVVYVKSAAATKGVRIAAEKGFGERDGEEMARGTSRGAKIFIIALPVVMVLALARLGYRLAWTFGGIRNGGFGHGGLGENEILYVLFEGVVMVGALAVAVGAHPGLWLLGHVREPQQSAGYAGDDSRRQSSSSTSSTSSSEDAKKERQRAWMESRIGLPPGTLRDEEEAEQGRMKSVYI